MTRLFLKPRPGTIVRFPRTGEILPEEGKFIILTSYWRRRIKAGDVVMESRKVLESKPKVETKNKERVHL